MAKHTISPWGMSEIALLCVALCLIVFPHYVLLLNPIFPRSRFTTAYYLSTTSLFAVALWYSLRRGILAAAIKGEISKTDMAQVGGICASLCVITMVHYAASVRNLYWHEIFQRAYYLPVIAGALWYGLQGGVLTAGLAAFLYLPHVFLQWHGFPSYRFNQFSEAVLFFVFGGLTGVLSDQQREQRDKLEQTAQRLSEVYAELQRSFESLRRTERLSALGRLSAGLAHELRNPLSAIEGAFDIVTRLDSDPERREEFRAIIRKELARLNDMLNHFLAFARPEAPRRKPTEVEGLMQEMRRLVSGAVSGRHISVRCKKADLPLPVISCDPDQIKEVMLNLVLNAGEAMPGGGDIELSATRDANSITIRVKDQGTGIPDEQLQQIFDPFYSTKPDGTGLGLSIASRIMEQHGGRIEVSRNPDRGMTFSLVLPLESGEAIKA